MSNELQNLILPFLLAMFTSGFLATIATLLFTRNKTKAEVNQMNGNSAATQVATAMLLVDNYKKEYSEVICQLSAFEKSNASLKLEMQKMEAEKDQIISEIKKELKKQSDQFEVSMREWRRKNEALTATNVELESRIRKLEDQLIEMNIVPVTHLKRKSDVKEN